MFRRQGIGIQSGLDDPSASRLGRSRETTNYQNMVSHLLSPHAPATAPARAEWTIARFEATNITIITSRQTIGDEVVPPEFHRLAAEDPVLDDVIVILGIDGLSRLVCRPLQRGTQLDIAFTILEETITSVRSVSGSSLQADVLVSHIDILPSQTPSDGSSTIATPTIAIIKNE